MKKFIKFSLSISLVLCLIFFVACSSNSPKDDADNIKHSNTKNFYAKTGYVPLKLLGNLKADGDIVYFDDSTCFVKNKSSISISVNSDEFESSKSVIADFKNHSMLSALKINNNIFYVNDIDLENITIKEDTEIEPIFSNFEILGVAASFADVSFPNSSAIFERDDLFYAYYPSFSSSKAYSSSSIISNINYKCEIVESVKPKYNFTLEIDTKNITPKTNLILKTDDDKFYLYSIEELKELESCTISVNFTSDLTTKPDIKK